MNSDVDRSRIARPLLDAVAGLPTQRLPTGHLCGLSPHLATAETTVLPRIDPSGRDGPGGRVVAGLLIVGGVIGLAVTTLGVVGRLEGVAGGVGGPLVPLLGLAGAAVLAAVGVVLLAGVELPRRAGLGLLASVAAAAVAARALLAANLLVSGSLCLPCLVGALVTVPLFWYATAFALARGWLRVPLAARRAVSVGVDQRRLAVACWWGGLALLAFLTGPWSAQDPVEGGTLAAVALISTATVAGAWVATRYASRMGLWLSLASAMMMVTALADIVPHVWHESEEIGTPLWLPALALVAGFGVVALLTRGGCGHSHGDGGHDVAGSGSAADPSRSAAFGGIGAAAALTAHRVIEGATIALTPSFAVVTALLVHSASEGLALAALFGQTRRAMLPWLAIAVAGPAVGVVVTTVSPLPEEVVPVLLAAVAGVLLRTAMVGLSLATAQRRAGRLRSWHVVVAVVAAAALAVVSLAGAGH